MQRGTGFRGAVVVFLLAVWSLMGCGAEEQEGDAPPEAAAEEAPSALDTLFRAYDHPALERPTYDAEEAQAWVDSMMNALTLEEKVGQLFIVEMPDPAAAGDEALQAVQQYGVGGFLVPRLLPPQKMFEETRRLQQAADVPLFMAADYERGVGRFSNPMTELPSNMAIGATRQQQFAAASGRLTALESRAVGVNLLFAPVVDVNNNPQNPIINIRSYGGRPALVGRMGNAYVQAAESLDVLTTLKHFPGHGNVSVDTHAEMGAITGRRAELDSVELRPYRMILEGGRNPAAIMSAHLWVQALDDQPLPATFSSSVLQGLLREELGFDGIVVTDDVTMGALNDDYSLTQRVTRPLQAGADIILTPENLGAAVRVVTGAVESGQVAEEQIDQSVRRILQAKAEAGLHRRPLASQEALTYLMEAHRGRLIAQTIADESITLLKSDAVLPLRDEQQLALVQLSNYRNSESIATAMDTLANTLASSYVGQVQLSSEPSSSQQRQILEQARQADAVVLALYLRLQSGRGEAGLFPAQRRLVRRLLEQDTPVVLMTFGNPYAVSTFPTAEGLLVAYDQTLASVRAAAGVLRGRQPPRGELPIRVEPYDYGAGLTQIPSQPAS